MYVRLLKHWNGYKPGRIFCDAPDGMAQVLIDRGLAVSDRPDAGEDPPVPPQTPAAPDEPAREETGEAPPASARVPKPRRKRTRPATAAE